MMAPVTHPVRAARFHRWHRVVLGLCFIAFAAELGMCLLILPWLSNWDMSYIPVHSPQLADIWMSPYFRGLLSGVGLLNVFIALSEASRLVRKWYRHKAKF